MEQKWRIETKDMNNKKITLIVEPGNFSFEEKQRSVSIGELTQVMGIIQIMNNNNYKKMECSLIAG